MTTILNTDKKYMLPLKRGEKIAIIEPSTTNHSSLIENWLRISQAIGAQPHIFSRPEVRLELSGNVEVFPVQKNPFIFAKQLKEKGIDRIIFSTLQTNFIYWVIFFIIHKKPKHLTIHNANYWLSPSLNCRFGSPKKIFKYFLRLIILIRSQSVVFCSEEQIGYARSLPNFSKAVSWVPFMLCSDEPQETLSIQDTSVKLRITLPGAVSEKRKRYDIFLDALETKKCLFELVLLGRLLEGELSDMTMCRIKKLKESGASIIIFYDYVPYPVFSDYIKRTHFLAADFIPVLTDGEYAGEVYGLTKETGVLGNMVRFKKPTLLRRGFPKSSKTSGSIFYFDTAEELIAILQEFIDKPQKYEQVEKNVAFTTRNFTLENVLAVHEVG